jgi:imidazoleglycerol-phosphate dehydratase/histidinol-phosphatase
VHIDRTLPADHAPTRKPSTGMLEEYLEGDYDLAQSFVIGDRRTDVELAQNLGARAIYIGENSVEGAETTTTDWDEIFRHLAFEIRKSSIERRTHETDVRLELALDGVGDAVVGTGLGFLDHMLSQVARHGRLDLRVEATGDLHVDEHHLVEDVALCLGQAVREALGDKRGIERYGFVLCMDDALTHMAVDFSGRSYLVWEGEFRRERIGDLPTELIEHFFRSFSDAAGCNLHVKIEGRNEHHKAESAFKALGKCIRQAARRDGNRDLPSTKGSL